MNYKTKKFKFISQIFGYARLELSKNGNPKKQLILKLNSMYYIATTATNSSAGYLFDSYSIGRNYEITAHWTKSGRLIIDYAKEI